MSIKNVKYVKYIELKLLFALSRPDFVLVRHNVRDAGADYRALLLLKFGGVPSINSLNSIYHFQVTKLFLQMFKV